MPGSLATLSLSLSALLACASTLLGYCTFDQIGMLERQTFCGQKQKSCCTALFRLRGTVNEPLTFKQRMPTQKIALQYQQWHSAL